MINKFTGMGYLSSDANFQEFKSGKKKITFSVGITISKETLWIEIEAWDKIAENCKKYLKKGSLVVIEGKLKLNSWKNKSGFAQSKITVVAEFIKVINTKNNESNQNNEANQNKQEIVKVKDIETLSKEIDQDLELQEDLDEIPW